MKLTYVIIEDIYKELSLMKLNERYLSTSLLSLFIYLFMQLLQKFYYTFEEHVIDLLPNETYETTRYVLGLYKCSNFKFEIRKFHSKVYYFTQLTLSLLSALFFEEKINYFYLKMHEI